MSAEESKRVFDAKAASLLGEELKGTFASGRTRSYEWRVSQLKALSKLVDDCEQQIVDALLCDLSKPRFETVVYEVSYLIIFDMFHTH